MHYWFKPKRFWRWFAAYYPVSWQGWTVFFFAASAVVYFFIKIDASSHSASDTFIGLAPYAIVVLIIVDFFTRAKGEYPQW